MTLAILKQTPTQKIARPFSRACSRDEAVELLQAYATRAGGGTHAEIKMAMERAASLPEEHAEALGMRWNNIDSDRPVLVLGTQKFYIFTEE